MVTYDQIVRVLSTNTLQEFELESYSRKYVGYTLLMKHYYHFLQLDDTVEYVIEGIDSLKVLRMIHRLCLVKMAQLLQQILVKVFLRMGI